MKTAAVLDSACLIGLENIGRLDLAGALLNAPPAVEREFGSRPSWLQVAAPADRPLLEALEANHFHIGPALMAEALRLAGE